MKTTTLFRALCFALALPLVPNLFAQEAPYIPGDILVMLKPGVSAQSIAHDLALVDGKASQLQVVKEVSAPMRAWLLHYENPEIPQALMLRLVDRHPAVQFAQNNHVVTDRVVPDDDEYADQWQHQNIDSEAAWDLTTGGLTATGDSIVVCIVENANLPHPDLIDNAWFNYGEIPNNNIDDDGNGYTDDFQGWNPGGSDDDVYGGSHGTQVAGMIGAKGNNGSQVVGANWNVKMMVVTRDGISEAAVVESYTYPLIMRRLYNDSDGAEGAFVVATNASWGIDNADHTQYPIWCAMYDTLGTEGVLNCGATANNNVDIDEVDDMPTGCESDFMVSVTATNDQDMRTFSAYGATTVDLGAPGEDVFTTTISGGTGSTSGTSFASPLTAGVIGLLYSAPCASLMDLVNNDPQAGALYVREALFNGVEQVGNLPGNTVTGGRVNSNNSLVWIMSNCGTCPAPYNLAAVNTTLGSATLNWSSSTATAFNVRYREVGATDWITVPDVEAFTLEINALVYCVLYEFQVEALCDGETSGFGASQTFTSEGCCTAPLTVTATAPDTSSAVVDWSSVLVASTYDLRYSVQGANDWTEITGLSGNSTTITGLTGCTTYEVQMRSACIGGVADWGPSALVSIPGCGQCADGVFCPSVGADAGSEWIDRVQLGTIDNESGSNDGYAAFTDQSTTIITGQDYLMTLTPGFALFPYTENWSVWIDFDGDGQFEDPDELVFGPPESTTAISGTFSLPLNAPVGPTRMRVIMKFQDPVADGCEDAYDFGETEDYCVNIEAGNGLAENAGLNATTYPNPADNELVISYAGRNSRIQVMDNTGRLVAELPLIGGRAVVNTHALANGHYVFRITGDASGTAQGTFEVLHR